MTNPQTPKPVINHNPRQERPRMHMADTYYFYGIGEDQQYYKKEVASYRKRYKDALAVNPLAIYIKPPKGVEFHNEDHGCPFRVEYRGYLYEENQGSQLVIAVDAEGYRTVVGSEWYVTLQEAFDYIDSLVDGVAN